MGQFVKHAFSQLLVLFQIKADNYKDAPLTAMRSETS